METLYELWSRRNPEWEVRYQESVINLFSDYGKGVNQFGEARAKLFGAGYEVFILAFFIGLYSNRTKPLVEDNAKRKHFGWAISNWGMAEPRLGRSQYPLIREYMFAALIAKTDIDFIALDKGEITQRKVVDDLIKKMEEYANYGFDYIQEKLEVNPNYFFKDTAFLRVFLNFVTSNNSEDNDEADIVPESLD